MFVPEIETTVTKWGKGVEAARHRDSDEACEAVREGAARAVERVDEIPPLTGFEPPFTVEVRFVEPRESPPEDWPTEGVEITQVDSRTFRRTSEEFARVYP
jgi:D-amino peptidase